jgi:hypothetical protein
VPAVVPAQRGSTRFPSRPLPRAARPGAVQCAAGRERDWAFAEAALSRGFVRLERCSNASPICRSRPISASASRRPWRQSRIRSHWGRSEWTFLTRKERDLVVRPCGEETVDREGHGSRAASAYVRLSVYYVCQYLEWHDRLSPLTPGNLVLQPRCSPTRYGRVNDRRQRHGQRCSNASRNQ